MISKTQLTALASILALFSVTALTGCGDDEKDGAANAEAAPATEAAAPAATAPATEAPAPAAAPATEAPATGQ